MPGTRKLGKTTAQRKAMLRQQVTDLLDRGQIVTTYTRAKEVGPLAEHMITLGKRKHLAAYRKALGFITRREIVVKVFGELATLYENRNGGYTRIVRIGPRKGDGAEMAAISLVDYEIKRPVRKPGEKKKKIRFHKKKKRSGKYWEPRKTPDTKKGR